MNKKISVGVTVSLVLLAVAISFTAAMIFAMQLFDEKVLSVQERASMYDKLSEIDNVVRQNFYYSIDDQYLTDELANGYIDGMNDADSTYLNSDAIAARRIEEAGTVISAGFEASRETSGYMQVTKIYSGTSAASSTLMVGDIITEIDGKNVLSIGYEAAAACLAGVEGSKLELTYTRDSEDVSLELVRSSIEAESVASYSVEGDICYIRIKALNDTTVAQFDYAVNAAVEAAARGLIFDLRGTKGGYDLSVAAELLDKMMPTGTIVSAKYMNGETKVLYTSDENCVTIPITLLVDQNTEGFAELFAVVVGDQENVSVVGVTTAGKGTLQNLYQLSDGSGLDLTVALLVTPVSGSFDGVGLKPDYEVAVEDFTLPDGQPDSTLDNQYRKALDVLNSMLR